MPAKSEFELIDHYFNRPAPAGMLGVGDDCALLTVRAGCELAVSTDMLIESRHFLPGVDPQSLGHKALAVNLSDLAAMGARPLACTLALGLPHIDERWLEGFSKGFHALAADAGCPLLGGDTTCSPHGIVLSITVMGELRPAHALRRSGAREGDDIWVSGTLGAAYVALLLLQGRLPADPARLRASQPAMDWPQPRLALGQALGGVAHAAIDISDGLLQDLGHILEQSHCAARLSLDALPAHPTLEGLEPRVRQEALLGGGDVYELCFTAQPLRREQIQALGHRLGIPLARIGTITRGSGIRVFDARGNDVPVTLRGFDHFAAQSPAPDTSRGST
ncbi:MAG TPA: thiamine-phosphate kinase [Castellaniella sp.]|uniref:thiamine-phosphate kinase n=1 Tax=Castellaniella sp. TaxID=1955812 RepID=UPI002EE5114D